MEIFNVDHDRIPFEVLDDHPLSRKLDHTVPFKSVVQYLQLMAGSFLIKPESMVNAPADYWQEWAKAEVEHIVDQIKQRSIIVNDPRVTIKGDALDSAGYAGMLGAIEVRVEATVAPKMARDIFSAIHAERYWNKPYQELLEGFQERWNRVIAVMVADLEFEREPSRGTFSALMETRNQLRPEEWEPVVKIGEKYTNYLQEQEDRDSKMLFFDLMRALNEMEKQ